MELYWLNASVVLFMCCNCRRKGAYGKVDSFVKCCTQTFQELKPDIIASVVDTFLKRYLDVAIQWNTIGHMILELKALGPD